MSKTKQTTEAKTRQFGVDESLGHLALLASHEQ